MIDNNDDGTGVASAGSVRKKSRTNGHCNICGSKLLLMFFPPSRNGHICDNYRCTLFASPQYYTTIPLDQLPPRKQSTVYLSLIRRDTPRYHAYLETRKQNYRCLRDLGVDSVEACHMTSNKQTKAYVESKGLVYYKGDK